MATKTVYLTPNFEDIKKNVDDFPSLLRTADKVFRIFVSDIFSDIISRSPVDKNFYRGDWEMIQKKGAGTLTTIVISNNMPYAGVMEEGSPVGGKPWASPGPKTVLKDGRIWSNQRAEPVAGGAVESADWEKLTDTLFKIIGKGL